ncbi:MAG: hypothetical protein IKO99_00465 [Bacteroidales bacterium]|nr:hypothetical protein [Bacteroidales bacterium]
MERLTNVLRITAFNLVILMPSCGMFDDFLTEDTVYGNKVIIENKTSNVLNCYYERLYDGSMRSEYDYNILVGGVHEYQETIPIEELFQNTLCKECVKFNISNGHKKLEYTGKQLDTLPDSIHLFMNVNAWVKDFYVANGDTFDILKFTFTDQDFD